MYKIKPQGWIKHLDFIILDVLSLHLAFIVSCVGYLGLDNPYAELNYLNIVFVYTLVNVIIISCNNNFKGVLKRGYYKEFVQTFKHTFFVELIVSFFVFSTKTGASYSRVVIYLIFILYTIISYSTRMLWKKFLLKKNIFGNLALYVITTNSNADKLVQALQKNNSGNYTFVGLCITDENCKEQHVSGVKVTATIDDVTDYLCREWVDEVYISLPNNTIYLSELINVITDMGIVVHQEVLYSESVIAEFQTVEKFAENIVITTSISVLTHRQAIIKRIIDIIAGIIGVFLTALIAIIIGPIIYIKSPGPIFFSQTRIGKNGKKFKMYKFRSMYLNAEERKSELMKENRVKDGMMFKLDFDPRIIGAKKLPNGTIKKGIGNFIRDWSIDEFPQFINVLLGDMSLVGTRPPTEDEWNKYKLHHRARLAFKPGITGMWQVSGRSNITDFEEVVKLDRQYIQKWSMGLDFKIVLRTVKVVLGKKGAM